MRIINPDVLRDLEAGKGLRLNLGAGKRLRPGFYSVDLLPLPGVDIVADLNAPLDSLPDNCVEEVYSRHTLEHVTEFLPLLAEIHRVTRPDARIELVVPHFSNPHGYSDPTHVRFFGLYSLFYFCDESDQPRRKVPNFYLPQRFRIESVTFSLLKHSLMDRLIQGPLQKLINRSIAWLDWYERRLCRWFPASSVRYVLHPKKVTESRLAA
jgi:SAM-dependent methyltransferase